ncbi:isocitrate lyase/phosphoenolpyruvate mutase family protein [Alteromonadaceae bacterium M269]|nr:isocitrate lyase/phosphoenolpyruvate mutase family protein [Alteromonadaceae bacterium M269]
MTTHQFSTFQSLHLRSKPIMLNNIWDAAGAALLAANSAEAIATSSASLAWSCGYADGSNLPRHELMTSVQRIRRITDLPVTIDIENGYSDSPTEVAKLVQELVNLGISEINIEDGQQSPSLLINKIKAIRDTVGENLFINARTDVYLQALVEPQHMLSESVSRTQQYIEAGANGVFVPGTLDVDVFSALVHNTPAPINAMIPSIEYDLNPLSSVGVKRFSLGPTPFLSCYSKLTDFQTELGFEQMNALF